MKKILAQNLAKFAVSGGSAMTLAIALLYLFTDIFRIWYLASSALAFVISVFYNFLLQKFWTFSGNQARGARQQLVMFFTISSVNLAVNATGMYFLVDIIKLWYLLSQVIMSALLAISNFFIYRSVVFKEANPIRNLRVALNPAGSILECNPTAAEQRDISNEVKINNNVTT